MTTSRRTPLTRPSLTALLALLLLVCSTGLAGGAQARASAPASTTASTASTAAAAAAPTVRLGAQFHGLWAEWDDASRARALDAMKANGVTALRVDVAWSMIEPRRGAYDYGWGVPHIDRLFAMAQQRGFRVLATLYLTPSWANGGKGDRVMPDDVRDYAKVAGFAAGRWKSVEAWQVWNEPNAKAFLNPPDPVAYTKLLRAAYLAIKAANPSARVVFGGTEYVDTEWIKRAYDAGAGPFFDVMAVHPYPGDAAAPPERASDGNKWWLTETPKLMALMKSRGDAGKSIWYTELGWSAHSNTSSTPIWARGVSEAQQADYLVRTLRLVQSSYPQVSRVYWYTSRDKATGDIHQDRFGLLRRDFSPRPVLLAAGCLYKNRC